MKHHNNIFPKVFPVSRKTAFVCKTTKTTIRVTIMVWQIPFFSVAHMSAVAVISVLIWVHTYMRTVAGNKMIRKQQASNFYGSFRSHAKFFCRSKHNHDRNCSLDHDKA